MISLKSNPASDPVRAIFVEYVVDDEEQDHVKVASCVRLDLMLNTGLQLQLIVADPLAVRSSVRRDELTFMSSERELLDTFIELIRSFVADLRC